ncbi:uncharacterized protein LOC135210977 [Macrobrachium nipponense]|uniref:uncharacterized protein LOC135210977 n=1 Tax=Macrobrachium nipponense TaxID=159736 RepID=UPI0030C809BC
MALFFKRLSPSSVSVAFFIILGILVQIPCHPVAAEEENREGKSPGITHVNTPNRRLNGLVNRFVYPVRGIMTGPPVYTHGTDDTLPNSQELEAQRTDLSDAQGDRPVSDNIESLTDTEMYNDSETKTHNQRSPRNSAADPLQFKDGCFSGDIPDDSDHPDEDTVELYDALNNMLEHIMGIDTIINDPEEIRMRAYVGERRAVGVHLILQEATYFWGNSLVENELDPLEGSGDAEEISEESLQKEDTLDPGLFLRQTYDADQEAAVQDGEEEEENEERSEKIDVKEGSKLRLVCNVTGVPSYRVEWQRGANLSFPGGAFVVGGRSVLLDYVAREDAGTYICTATTPSGHFHSSGVSISVHYRPVVGLWSRDTEANSVELGCLAEGHPRPSAVWYVNNTKITLDNCPWNAEIRSSELSPNFALSVLTLYNVTSSDFGYYHCRASSSVGVSRGYVMLHDDSGVLDPQVLEDQKPVKHPAPLENPRLSSFLLGMVPPLYIGLYIIAYLGCYKTSISGVGGHGRFGGGVDMMED